MKKLFLLIIKYLPIIQMVGFIFNACFYIVAEDVRYIKLAIPRKKDIAFTYTLADSNISIIGISETTSCNELINSIVHELNHVKISILEKFNIKYNGEEAAYLIGELAREAHKLIEMCILSRP